MNEYLVQLKGTYLIHDELKSLFKNLNLKKEFLRIDEDVNIKIYYMSFLVDAENEFKVTSEKQFFQRIKDGLKEKCNEENEVYKKYIDYINQFHISNLKLDELYIKPTGREAYNEKHIDYSLLTNKERAYITYSMTRILTSYEIDELDNYYECIINRINKQKLEAYNNKENLIEMVSYFYINQKQQILDGKKISMFNKKKTIKWVMCTPREWDWELDFDWYQHACRNSYNDFFWQSNDEYIYRDSSFDFKYKYFINIGENISKNVERYRNIIFECDEDFDMFHYTVSLDLVISPENLSKEKLEYIAKTKNIDIENISYKHINSCNNLRFNLYNKDLDRFDLEKIIDTDNYDKNHIHYGGYVEYIECEFNPTLLIKDILKQDGSLNINLLNKEFKSFYIDMIESSIIDKFIAIKELRYQMNEIGWLLKNILFGIEKPDNCDEYLNSLGDIRSLDKLNEYAYVLAKKCNICYNCYSRKVSKPNLVDNEFGNMCDKCEDRYQAEYEAKCEAEYKYEHGDEDEYYDWDSSVPPEVWESIDNMME